MTSIGVEHFDLTNRKAIVLGADNPGGAAVARAFAEGGADLVIGVFEHDRNVDMLQADLESMGARCSVLAVDLQNPRHAGEAVCNAAAQLGSLDLLAVCCDAFLAKPIDETTDADLDDVMSMNYGVAFSAVRAAVSEMRRRGQGGRLLILTHVLGERGLPNTAAYGAAHAAIHNLVRTLGRELGPDGITINAIALGWMDWMSDRLNPQDEESERAIRFALVKRAGQPDDIGPMAVWLAGSGAGYVTGQIFHLDGGLTQHL
ncbi:MAG: SDR family NAD(P)-dependent oxidoreductase [Dehalococcoidia bacterium]